MSDYRAEINQYRITALFQLTRLAWSDPRLTAKVLLSALRARARIMKPKVQKYHYTWLNEPMIQQSIEDERIREIASNFNLFREHYTELSFEDLKKVNTKIYQMYPSQTHFNSDFVKSCIKYMIKRLGKKRVIIDELGGYQGELAYEILKSYPAIVWRNFEIIPHKRVQELSQYNYEELVLNKPLWLTEIDLSNCEVFIMCDTIEHFIDDEARRILNLIRSFKVKSIIIKSPLTPKGQTWVNYPGYHVLKMGSIKLKEEMARDYRLSKEIFDCFFWVRKNM